MDSQSTLPRISISDLAGIGSEAPERAARFLKSIAHRDRLKILCVLVAQELSVSEIKENVGLRQSAISQHLARMKEEGFISGRRDGRQIYYSIADPAALSIIMILYERFCEEKPSDI